MENVKNAMTLKERVATQFKVLGISFILIIYVPLLNNEFLPVVCSHYK